MDTNHGGGFIVVWQLFSIVKLKKKENCFYNGKSSVRAKWRPSLGQYSSHNNNMLLELNIVKEE
jgi:hypothetical protein